MSSAAPAVEAIDVGADELVRGRASVDEGPPPSGGDGGGGGDGLPPLPPPSDEGHGLPERPARWKRLVLWGAIFLLAGLVGWFIGRPIGELGLVIERGLTRGEG